MNIIKKSLLLILLAIGSLHVQAQNACDRTCVTKIVDDYVAAMMAKKPNAIDVSSNLKITENGKTVKLGEGVWKTVTAHSDYHQIVIDDGLQEAVFFGAFKEGDDELLMAIRFKLSGKTIVEIENLLSRFDERNRLISRHKLTQPHAIYETIAPAGKQLSRDELIKAGHAYFDGIANSSDEGVPMHRECHRRENGVTLLKNDNPTTQPCPIGFHRFNYIPDIRDRRVAVVDRERNLVLMWAFFDVPGNIEVDPRPLGPSDLDTPAGRPRVDTRKIPRSLYIAELFRLEDGLIRDIEAIMFNMDLGTKSGWE